MKKILSFFTALVLSGSVNATVISSENFNAGATGWSNNTTTNFGGHLILGGYNTFGSGDVISKNFALSGEQSTIDLEFDFYRIDTWDNEFFNVSANGAILAQDSYTFSGGSNIGGQAFNDEIIHYSLSFDTNLANLALTFSGSLDQSKTDESWGIDNLLITQTVTAVPVPAAFWLFGSALGLLGWMRRKAS